MRLDKYLKLSRIIKRRTVAHDAAEGSKVFVNGRAVKPSYDVKVNDIIEIKYFKKAVKVKVLIVKDVVRKDEADNMYEVLEETDTEN